MGVLRMVGRTAATVVPVAQLARLGLPGLLVVVGLVGVLSLLSIGTLWWVISNDARSVRTERLLRAIRGRRK